MSKGLQRGQLLGGKSSVTTPLDPPATPEESLVGGISWLYNNYCKKNKALTGQKHGLEVNLEDKNQVRPGIRGRYIFGKHQLTINKCSARNKERSAKRIT